MKYNEEAFEGTIDIVAAAMEEAEVELSAEGGKQVAEFFEAIYKRLAVIAAADDDDDDDDDEDDDDDDDEEDDEEDDEGDEDDDEDEEDSDEEDGEIEEESEEAPEMGEEIQEESKAEEAEDQLTKEPSVSRTGSFEVYTDAKGKYRFRLKASNGQTIAVSQAYKKKESCLKGLESVKKNAAAAVIKEV